MNARILTLSVLAAALLVAAWVSLRPGDSAPEAVGEGRAVSAVDRSAPSVELVPLAEGSEGALKAPVERLDATDVPDEPIAAPVPWTAVARVVRTDQDGKERSPVPINTLISGMHRRVTVRALPEMVAPGSAARSEESRVRLVNAREQEWTFRVADAEADKVILGCMLGDLVIETQLADKDHPEVEFRMDMASLRRQATGSVRFRVMTRREGDNGGPTGKKIHLGMAGGRGVEHSKGAMWPYAEGEWHELKGIPTCEVRLLARGHNSIPVERRFQLEPGQNPDLGTIYTDEPWDFVFFQLRKEDGELAALDGSTLDLKTGWKQSGWQEWGEPGNFLLVTRAVHDLGIRVEKPGWSEVPIRIGRDQIFSGPPDEVQKKPFAQVTVTRAPTVTWGLSLPSRFEHDYVVLRESDGSPIRIYPAGEVETVVSFLPPGTYIWTHHRDTGAEIGRVQASTADAAGLLELRM